MTIPLEYARASAVFDRLVDETRIALDHVTRHPTFTTIEAVLRVFRRRLDAADAIAFAAVLPAVPRAMFVKDWDDFGESARPFATREEMEAEVRGFRRDHNLSPPGSIGIVTAVLRRHMDPLAFDRVIGRLPVQARAFWGTTPEAL